MGSADFVIDGGKVFFNGAVLEGGVAIRDGMITAVAKGAGLPKGDEHLNIGGRILCPGLIDAHVHLRDMNYSYKEDFMSGTMAATAGGFTTVLDMPNTDPVTDSLAALAEKMERARTNIYANVGFYLALTRRTDFRALPMCVGLKAYLYSPREGLEVDAGAVSQAARHVPEGYPIAVHAEKGQLIHELYDRSRKGGIGGVERFLYCHPQEAESQSVSEVIRTAPEGAALHFAHISLPGCVSEIRGARRRASIEVTPHHLILSSDDARKLGAKALMDPPLRGVRDLRGLMEALGDGAIDVVASDHAPHSQEEKGRADPLAGIPGLETLVPVMLSCVWSRSIGLATLIRALSSRPAEIFGLDGRGRLKVGATADLTVLDLKRTWTIDSAKFLSKAKYSPFDGLEVKGGPWATFVRGRPTFIEGEIVAQRGIGKILGRGRT
jgi:dihydroorotase